MMQAKVSYFDPNFGCDRIRDLEIELQAVFDASGQLQISHHIKTDDQEHTVVANDLKNFLYARRLNQTTQTQVIAEHVKVKNANIFSAGDAVAINGMIFLIEAITDDYLCLYPKTDIPIGSVVERLELPNRSSDGLITNWQKPAALAFYLQDRPEGIRYFVPAIWGDCLVSYDVYVRQEPFEKLELEWLPVIWDVPIDQTTGIIDVPVGYYYVTVVGKTANGLESAFMVKSLERKNTSIN